jgi:Protein of unknown function (DUF2934)
MKVPVKKRATKATNSSSPEFRLELEEQIRFRAYELYVQRGNEAGHETEDWLAAEAELTSKRIRPSAAESVKSNRKHTVTKPGTTSRVSRTEKKKDDADVEQDG